MTSRNTPCASADGGLSSGSSSSVKRIASGAPGSGESRRDETGLEIKEEGERYEN